MVVAHHVTRAAAQQTGVGKGHANPDRAEPGPTCNAPSMPWTTLLDPIARAAYGGTRRIAAVRRDPPGRAALSSCYLLGRRGSRVMATARDVMTADPDRVAHTDTLHEVARRMRTLLVAFLPVCDEDGDLCGIIAYRHIGWPCDVQGGDPAAVTAASLAEEPPVTIGVDDPVDHIWQVMAEQRLWLLPVLDGRRLVGVIHYADIAATSGSAAPRRPAPPPPSAQTCWPRPGSRSPRRRPWPAGRWPAPPRSPWTPTPSPARRVSTNPSTPSPA